MSRSLLPSSSAFDRLAVHLRTISRLNSISELLSWDQQTMMPSGGATARGAQLSALAGTIHELRTSDVMRSALEDAEDERRRIEEGSLEEMSLDLFALRTIELARKEFDKATKVPKELVEREAELSAEGYQIWEKARENNDFPSFVPILKQWVDLRRQIAACIDPNRDAYDVLLDNFERGMTRARLDQLFEHLKQELIPLVRRICERAEESPPRTDFLKGCFPVEKQREISLLIAREFGFNFDRGRLDVSVHPFTVGPHPTDVRITTRFSENEFFQGLAGTAHETGHALYEQGRNLDYDGLPVNEALSMGVHESQSLLWERHVGQSLPYWRRFWPRIREILNIDQNIDADEAYRGINCPSRSFIRVEADELTYPLHVILRYELEKDLMDGVLQPEDLATAWNMKMKNYLGIVPETDREGVLQDVHWSEGYFGYFPTYLLGAANAAQLFDAASKDIGNISEKIEQGNFSDLLAWLRRNVHQRGSLVTSDILLTDATGSPLDSSFLVRYLEEKYSSLFPN